MVYLLLLVEQWLDLQKEQKTVFFKSTDFLGNYTSHDLIKGEIQRKFGNRM